MLIHFSNKMIKQHPEIYDIVPDLSINKIVQYVINSKYRRAVRLRAWIEEQIKNPSKELIATAKKITTIQDKLPLK